MALTGLQIHKLLPKTNCKECGSNTCLAFAMKLAARKAELSECPYASDEAKQVLGASAEPPVRALEFGSVRKVRTGGETVLYRHEKTFVSPTLLAVPIGDELEGAALEARLDEIAGYSVQRVGHVFGVDMICVVHKRLMAKQFADLVLFVSDRTGLPIVVRSRSTDVLLAVSVAMKGRRCLLASAETGTIGALGASAAENGHVLAVASGDLDELWTATDGLRKIGFNDIVIELESDDAAGRFQFGAVARRAAIKDNCKPLGYAHLRFIDTSSLLGAASMAATEIAKYGGVCVLPSFDPALLCAMITLRLNIYTDPQKPIQVEPKLYPVGEPTPDSPVFCTTNFSLTYFIVSGEIENSGTSGWLLVPECEGMSVLTAWAAGKFNGLTIAKFAKQIDIDSLVRTREIVIPGHVAMISGELEENLPGWKAVVGPQEAGDIESFVKARLGR